MAVKSKKSTSSKKGGTKKSTPKKKTISVKPKTAKSLIKKNQTQTFNLLVAALVFMLLAMGYMRFKYLLVPASVNGSPIFSWKYVKALHQSAGNQVIDQLVVEKLITQEARKQNIEINSQELEAEFQRLEAQFESVGGLDAFLASQGLSKKDVNDQVKLNLQVQKIVAGNISITDEEVDEYYQENKDSFDSSLTEEEIKKQAYDILYEQRVQQQIGIWIQDLRAKGQITINFPNAQTQ